MTLDGEQAKEDSWLQQEAWDCAELILELIDDRGISRARRAGIIGTRIDDSHAVGPRYVFGGPCCSIAGPIASDSNSPPCPTEQDCEILDIRILIGFGGSATATLNVLINGGSILSLPLGGGGQIIPASALGTTRLHIGDAMLVTVTGTDPADTTADLTVCIRCRLDVLTDPMTEDQDQTAP